MVLRSELNFASKGLHCVGYPWYVFWSDKTLLCASNLWASWFVVSLLKLPSSLPRSYSCDWLNFKVVRFYVVSTQVFYALLLISPFIIFLLCFLSLILVEFHLLQVTSLWVVIHCLIFLKVRLNLLLSNSHFLPHLVYKCWLKLIPITHTINHLHRVYIILLIRSFWR